MPTTRIGHYSTRAAAEVARSALRSEGVAAEVVADDAGGAGGLPLSLGGVTLRIDVADSRQAREILGLGTEDAVPADASGEAGGFRRGTPTGRSSTGRSLTALVALAVIALAIGFNLVVVLR